MICECGAQMKVTDTRPIANGTRRRYKCKSAACGERLVTREYSENQAVVSPDYQRLKTQLVDTIAATFKTFENKSEAQ